jgi:hypothetical protein
MSGEGVELPSNGSPTLCTQLQEISSTSKTCLTLGIQLPSRCSLHASSSPSPSPSPSPSQSASSSPSPSRPSPAPRSSSGPDSVESLRLSSKSQWSSPFLRRCRSSLNVCRRCGEEWRGVAREMQRPLSALKRFGTLQYRAEGGGDTGAQHTGGEGCERSDSVVCGVCVPPPPTRSHEEAAVAHTAPFGFPGSSCGVRSWTAAAPLQPPPAPPPVGAARP